MPERYAIFKLAEYVHIIPALFAPYRVKFKLISMVVVPPAMALMNELFSIINSYSIAMFNAVDAPNYPKIKP